MTGRLVIVAHEVGAWVNHRAATADTATAAGWKVTLLMGGEGDPVPLAAEGGPTYHSLPMARGHSGAREIAASLRVLRRMLGDADVAELVTLKPIALGMLAWRTLPPSRRPRMVATFAGLGTVLDAALPRRRSWLVFALRALLRGRAHILVENPDDAQSLVGAGIVKLADVTVGPGVGLPASWLALPPNRTDRTDRDRTRALYVGRLIASKGVNDLVAAARILRERDVPVDVVLVGALDDRNPSAIAAAEVAGWQQDGLVLWRGHVTDILSEYRSCDVVVLASHREGRPRSLMEAQALGIPVIATDVPGCRQAMLAGRTGLLVAPHDPAALADAIETLATDRSMRDRFGAAARTYAREQFGDDHFLKVWKSVVLGS